VKQVFRLVLMGCSSAHTVVDVGANTGYYSMASAAFGCRVLAFEAQPGCRQWWEAARLANDANVTRANGVGGPFSYFDTSRVKLVTRPVSAHPATVEIDQWACWVMHKIDQRLRRRQRRRHGVDDASPPASALASVSGPPPPPPPPPLAVDPEAHARPGKLALRPIGAAELTALLAPSERVLLTKVDTEGAELAVLGALEPLLPRTEHLIVEVAPGWWELYRNRTARSGRGGERHTTRGDGHAPLTSEVAASMQLRANGAQQLSRLLTPQSKGGWGFAAALTSNGRHFTDAATFHEFIVHMGSNGYWHQQDVWFSRDAATVARARLIICKQQQSSVRASRCALR